MSDNPAQRVTKIVLPAEADHYAHLSGRDDALTFESTGIPTLTSAGMWEGTLPGYVHALPGTYFPNG